MLIQFQDFTSMLQSFEKEQMGGIFCNGSKGLTHVPFSLPVVCYRGDAGVDLAFVAGVGISGAVAAQLGAVAASVPHQKEAKDGGNVQAQRGGEEADRSGGARKSPSASTAAQRRTPHLTP